MNTAILPGFLFVAQQYHQLLNASLAKHITDKTIVEDWKKIPVGGSLSVKAYRYFFTFLKNSPTQIDKKIVNQIKGQLRT